MTEQTTGPETGPETGQQVGQGSGRTRALPADGEQLLDVVVTPAAPDLACWLWAAFPPRKGRLDTRRVAGTFMVSQRTVQRWLHDAPADMRATRAQWVPLNPDGMRVVRRRAILRGHGHYLWPPADPTTLDRSVAAMEHAETARANLLELGPSARDIETGRNAGHEVHLVHFPGARVFGVATSYHDKTLSKLMRHGEVLETVGVPDKWAAVILKETVLQMVGPEHRCIAPRHLVPTGRTETWLESAGDVDLAAIATQLDLATPNADPSDGEPADQAAGDGDGDGAEPEHDTLFEE
jgi:hypothetical protein